MCGISGIYSKSEVSQIHLRISKMTTSLSHRGPDDNGIYISENKKVGLGHNRLSIIDTRKISNQPMISQSKRWTIVFNGEIYNYLNIRSKLKYEFKTNSDTEVILAAIETKGINWFLNVANGMFSIAIYDNEQNQITLIRDRFGIKPLYYYYDENKLIFGSEIKAILNSGLINAKFNYLAIDEYLGNRQVREPYTFFEGIFQLKSGSYLKISENLEINEIKFWTLPDNFNENKIYDPVLITKKLEEKLIESIRLRLVSDVPLGTFLSGGLDSSLLSSITTNLLKESINTYTIGFKEMNEFNYSKLVSNHINSFHHIIELNEQDYFEEWLNLLKYKDAPLSVPNEIPLAIMSKELKSKITVVLSGEGADELMGGYGKIYRLPEEFIGKSNFEFYHGFVNEYEYVSRRIRDSYLKTDNSYRKVFDQINIEKFELGSKYENIFRFFHNYHIKGLLNRVDCSSMQASVEARVPFLDHELVEFCYKEVPLSLKLKWNSEKQKYKALSLKRSEYSEIYDMPKYILKKIAENYLPKEIIYRKKIGFPVPLNHWFKNLNKLSKEILMESEWISKDKTIKLISESKKESRFGQILWMFLNIELFKNEYFNKNWKW